MDKTEDPPKNNEEKVLPRNPFAQTAFPIIHVPWFRMGEHWTSYQGTKCEDIELDYLRCAAPVGARRAVIHCRPHIEDLLECVYKKKHKKRYEVIQARRKELGLAPMKAPPHDFVYKHDVLEQNH